MSIQESMAQLAEAEQAYKSAHPGRDLTVAREELTNARGAYCADCVRLVERLPELLAPFAEEAGGWHASCLDHWHPVIGTQQGDDNDAAFTIGDLRALGALYEEVKQ